MMLDNVIMLSHEPLLRQRAARRRSHRGTRLFADIHNNQARQP